MSGNTYVDEFRGTDELYIADVLVDDNEVGSGHGYITGTPELLAPVAEISRTVATASETKYYNNGPALTINAEGADTVNINVPALPLAVLAHVTGKKIDASTGGLMDGESTPPYMALGYRLGLTDGTYRYVWRLKGTFAVPAETSQTKDAGTDSQGQQLVFTGINTIHKFTKAVDAQGNHMTQKAWVCDERDMKADLSGFFSQVTTCDNAVAKQTYTLSITQATGTTVTVKRGNQILSSSDVLYAGDVLTITCTGGTLTVNSNSFTSGNTLTVSANVTVVSTASV